MKLIKESNISNVIIFSSMFIITTLMVFNGYYFITKQYDILERGIEESKAAFVESQKKSIQREVDSIIDMIKFKHSFLEHLYSSEYEELYKEELKSWIRSIRFGINDENYIFIYEVEDFDGGEQFAKMLVNANRPDLEGKYISSNYKDTDGKQFRKIFLEQIRDKGYGFVDYMYKKPESSDIRPKVSYFRLYKNWNWIIAAGAYLDNIDAQIEQDKISLKRTVQLEITSAIIIFLFFSLVANAFAIFLGKQIERFFKDYHTQVQNKTQELQELNKTLENRVALQLQKSREQEQLLIQKSKFIALGEMISNIAHQWRQPLSELSAIIMTVKLRFSLDKLDEESMEKKYLQAETLLEYMSKTIDDFRDFFSPKKEKKHFPIKSAIDAVINIIGSSAKDKNISLNINVDESEMIFGQKNEFEQVLLNIITNAKQLLIINKIRNPKIEIFLNTDKKYVYLYIRDNAGGIQSEPIEKIFEPYFTTKEESGGTGIGLYMSKLIIEKNMGGILSVKNVENGAMFIMRFRRHRS